MYFHCYWCCFHCFFAFVYSVPVAKGTHRQSTRKACISVAWYAPIQVVIWARQSKKTFDRRSNRTIWGCDTFDLTSSHTMALRLLPRSIQLTLMMTWIFAHFSCGTFYFHSFKMPVAWAEGHIVIGSTLGTSTEFINDSVWATHTHAWSCYKLTPKLNMKTLNWRLWAKLFPTFVLFAVTLRCNMVISECFDDYRRGRINSILLWNQLCQNVIKYSLDCEKNCAVCLAPDPQISLHFHFNCTLPKLLCVSC